MTMTRKVLFTLAFAVAHTVATVLAIVSALGAVMSGFEPGQPAASPAAVRFFLVLPDILMFPLGTLLGPHGMPGLWGYLLFFGNGIVWASVIVACWGAVARSRGVDASSPARGG